MTSAEHEVVYDIRLLDRVPESLRSEFPGMRVHTTGARTVLRLRADEPVQLSRLLEKLRSVGGAVTGIHRCVGDGPRGTAATYEVWVRDELGSSLLWYLHCAHRVVPVETQVRVSLGAGRLQRFVRACASCGTRIDRVRRVDPVAEPVPPT